MPNFERKVLVLDSRYQPVKIVSLEAGFTLLYTQRAVSILDSDRSLRTINSTFNVPWIILLQNCSPRVKKTMTPRLSRHNVYLRDGYACQYCGWRGALSNLTLDHLIPCSRGGKTIWENVITACRSCNHRKGSRTIEELGVRPKAMPFRPSFSPTAIFALRYGLTRLNVPKQWEDYLDLSITDQLVKLFHVDEPEHEIVLSKAG